MNHLTKLHFNLPISLSIHPKLLLNTIEKKVFLLAIAIFSSVSLLCFAVFTYLKNRKAVEIKDKNINLGKFSENKLVQKENKEEQVNNEKQEKRDEKKEIPNGDSLQPSKGQVAPEKGKEVKSDPNPKLIPRPISAMSYEEDDMKKVFEVYTKQNDDTPIKAECEVYFKNAILLPKDKINIKAFHNLISGYEKSKIVDMMLNAAFESLNDASTDKAVKDNIYFNFCEIFDLCHSVASSTYVHSDIGCDKTVQNEFVDLLQKFLNHAVYKSSEVSGEICLQTIVHLFKSNKPEEIVKIILNTKREPFDLIKLVLLILPDEEQRRKVNEVVDESFQSCTDAAKLGRLYDDESHGNTIDLFSDKQMGILFQHWMKTLSEDQFLEKISLFIGHRLKDTSIVNVRVVEGILNAHPNIDLEKLMTKNGRSSLWVGKFRNLVPYLAGFYMMRQLENNTKVSTDNLNALFHTVINSIDPKSDTKYMTPKDCKVFVYFLAERCSNIQIQSIIMGFKNLKTTPSRFILVKGFLKAILKSNNLERIKLAFANFWSCYKEFRVFFSDRVEERILKEIDSEDKLKAVYDACQSLPQNDDIKTLLREGIKDALLPGTDLEHTFVYRVKLPLDVVKRIVQ